MKFAQLIDTSLVPSKNPTCYTNNCWNVFFSHPTILFANKITTINTGILFSNPVNSIIKVWNHENVPWRCCELFLHAPKEKPLVLSVITDRKCFANPENIVVHLELITVHDGYQQIKGIIIFITYSLKCLRLFVF
jgi:hypothetical protein